MITDKSNTEHGNGTNTLLPAVAPTLTLSTDTEALAVRRGLSVLRVGATSKPILFSTPMVHAILEGRKTQTRRIINPQPDDDGLWNHTLRPMSIDPRYYLEGWHGTVDETGESKQFKCPYECDTLWVRETYTILEPEHCEGGMQNRFFFKAGQESNEHWRLEEIEKGYTHYKWKPSIFMRKDACRIFLKVENIRVERLQSISYKDCLAEGMKYGVGNNADLAYRKLWEKLNGKESWISNPWVWVVSFSRVQKNGVYV